jgi:hypothetical protein
MTRRVRSSKPPRNPVSRWLAIAAFTTLGVVGVAAVFGLDELMERTALPLGILCSLLVIVYTAWSLNLGWIATIGHVGQVHHFQRAKEPILFWLLVVLYLVLAVPTATYMISSVVK